jgi:CRISPR/Cas system CSM-associated protein Csm3 (group 7 of RAMP superfamily)
MHHPNPFDFVPLPAAPKVRKPETFDALGPSVSGYLELSLATLTPLHIVGTQQIASDRRSADSKFYRQNMDLCIPAASIRGMLRSFIEALTAGWVSQVTPVYEKKPNTRHIGFAAFEKYASRGRTQNRLSPPALKSTFKPSKSGELDVASYLFGIVVEKEKGESADHKDLAYKSKVWVEDAYISEETVEKRYWMPDIDGQAFMGGPKPSASNWWYFQPQEIWRRQTGNHDLAEFVGAEFWGRKFYYHQNPQTCTAYYDGNGGKWRYAPSRPFRKVWLECMKAKTASQPFRIYLDRVPKPLAVLLVRALLPGSTIRHKLGYAKAYGYGSVEFHLSAARLRTNDPATRIPPALSDWTPEVQSWSKAPWSSDGLTPLGIADLIDWDALDALARVLGWKDIDKLLFTYPPFGKVDFMTPVRFQDLNGKLPSRLSTPPPIRANTGTGRTIAENLFGLKRTIHFRLYQERAQGWNLIAGRKP